MIENYISYEDIMVRIKTNPDITKDDKEKFDKITKTLKLSEKAKQRLSRPTLTNQQRNAAKSSKE